MSWMITYYNKHLEEEILGLPDSLLARYIRLTEVMIEYGPNLGMPHTRFIDKSLFELRLKGRDGIGRVFYCLVKRNEIMMLHSFVKKTQKTPRKELTIAAERMKKVNIHV